MSWGRGSKGVVDRLAEFGFRGLSTKNLRQASRESGLAIANTHVLFPKKAEDGWSFSKEAVVADMVSALTRLRSRASDPFEPIGINTHHKALEQDGLAVLSELISVTGEHGGVWLHPRDVFADVETQPASDSSTSAGRPAATRATSDRRVPIGRTPHDVKA